MNIISACNIFDNLIKQFAGTARSPKKRGIACILAEHSQNLSHLDKFPINKPSEAKQALKRISIMTKAPKWWDGSLDELKSIITKKINDYYIVEKSDKGLSVIKK